jgi:hypothetical protein
MLFKRGWKTLKGDLQETTFKPASKAQIAEWTAWLSSPEAKVAHNALLAEKAMAKDMWKSHKFSVLQMERHLDSMWPMQKAEYKLGTMYMAYTTYADEQNNLLLEYNSVKKNSKFDCGKVDEAYNALINHINTHGQLIEEIPKHDHKNVSNGSNTPTKVGRRAARRVRNEIGEEIARVYTRAELRALARGDEASVVPTEGNA